MRLIDADALIEMIEKDIQMTEKFMSNFDFANPSEMASKKYASLFSQLNTLKSYKSIISEQQTAYDPEAVVAELESKKYWEYDDEGFSVEMVVSIGNAIEVVRKGGV